MIRAETGREDGSIAESLPVVVSTVASRPAAV
jgi:hypothetical protein